MISIGTLKAAAARSIIDHSAKWADPELFDHLVTIVFADPRITSGALKYLQSIGTDTHLCKCGGASLTSMVANSCDCGIDYLDSDFNNNLERFAEVLQSIVAYDLERQRQNERLQEIEDLISEAKDANIDLEVKARELKVTIKSNKDVFNHLGFLASN